jgi:hypothetical protein
MTERVIPECYRIVLPQMLERNQSWCDLMKSVPGLRSLVVPSTRGLRFRIQSLWFRSK